MAFKLLKLCQTGIGYSILLACSSSAQADPAPAAVLELPAQWSTTTKGCKVWNPKPQPEETVEWTGPCVDGYADGEGSLRWYKSGILKGDYPLALPLLYLLRLSCGGVPCRATAVIACGADM